jgi:hypothetical protein
MLQQEVGQAVSLGRLAHQTTQQQFTEISDGLVLGSTQYSSNCCMPHGMDLCSTQVGGQRCWQAGACWRCYWRRRRRWWRPYCCRFYSRIRWRLAATSFAFAGVQWLMTVSILQLSQRCI